MQQERGDKSRDNEDRWWGYKEVIEEVYRRDKFDKKFDIGLISECEEDGSNSEDEEENSGEDSD